MSKAEKAGVAEQDVVADGIAGQHHDPGEAAMVIGGQDELQHEQGALT